MEFGNVRTWVSIAAALVAVVACGAGSSVSGYTPEDADSGARTSRGASDAAPAADADLPQDEDAGGAASFSAFDRGMIAVAARGCPSCHQSSNLDDGVLSGQLVPVPGTRAFGTNLTPDLDTGIGAWTDEEILRAIRQGSDQDGAQLCAVMPHFPDLTDDEGATVLAYLHGIAPVRRDIPESECGGADDGDGGAAPDAAVDAASCAGWAKPTVSAACHACQTRPCQANGCFGGYYCDTGTWTCHPAPAGCE